MALQNFNKFESLFSTIGFVVKKVSIKNSSVIQNPNSSEIKPSGSNVDGNVPSSNFWGEKTDVIKEKEENKENTKNFWGEVEK